MPIPWPIAVVLIVGVLCIIPIARDPFNIDGDWYGKLNPRKKK